MDLTTLQNELDCMGHTPKQSRELTSLCFHEVNEVIDQYNQGLISVTELAIRVLVVIESHTREV